MTFLLIFLVYIGVIAYQQWSSSTTALPDAGKDGEVDLEPVMSAEEVSLIIKTL